MLADPRVRDTVQAIVEKIVAGYQPEKIILFGSYAYGSPDPDSDIDLLIIKRTDERPIDRRVAVTGLASDPKRLIPLEPLVLTPDELAECLATGNQFIEEILREGELVYEA